MLVAYFHVLLYEFILLHIFDHTKKQKEHLNRCLYSFTSDKIKVESVQAMGVIICYKYFIQLYFSLQAHHQEVVPILKLNVILAYTGF